MKTRNGFENGTIGSDFLEIIQDTVGFSSRTPFDHCMNAIIMIFVALKWSVVANEGNYVYKRFGDKKMESYFRYMTLSRIIFSLMKHFLTGIQRQIFLISPKKSGIRLTRQLLKGKLSFKLDKIMSMFIEMKITTMFLSLLWTLFELL